MLWGFFSLANDCPQQFTDHSDNRANEQSKTANQQIFPKFNPEKTHQIIQDPRNKTIKKTNENNIVSNIVLLICSC